MREQSARDTYHQIAAAAAGSRTPGKRTLTEQLPRRRETAAPRRAPANQPADQPELAPTVDDVAYREVEGQAFVRGAADKQALAVNDVNQGLVGDCFFLAALASVTATSWGPEYLASGIVSEGEDGKHWKVRLHAPLADGKFEEIWYSVDNQLATDRAGNLTYARSTDATTKSVSDGVQWVPGEDGEQVRHEVFHKERDKRELWPALYEKAYAMHAPRMGTAKQGARAGGYDDLDEGGFADKPFMALTGRPAQGIHAAQADDLFSQIASALRLGLPVAASTGDMARNQGGETSGGTGLYEDHAYSVLTASAKGGAREVVVRNPWGKRFTDEEQAANPATRRDRSGGTFAVDFAAFSARFTQVFIGGKPA